MWAGASQSYNATWQKGRVFPLQINPRSHLANIWYTKFNKKDK